MSSKKVVQLFNPLKNWNTVARLNEMILHTKNMAETSYIVTEDILAGVYGTDDEKYLKLKRDLREAVVGYSEVLNALDDRIQEILEDLEEDDG